MKRWTSEQGFQALIGLGFVVAGAAMAWQTFLIDADGGYAGIGPRFFPLVVAAGLAICGIGLALQAMFGGYLNLDEIPERVGAAGLKGLAWILGGLIFQLLTIGMLGFVPTATVLFVCVARAFGVKSWLRPVIIGAVLALAIWGIFTELLGVSLQGFLRA